MFRSLMIAASLFGVAAPALAEGSVSATPGALAGRSPHHMRIATDASTDSCGKVMHSIPAGKPHTYGLNAMAKPCVQPELASIATTQTAAAAD